jgi:diguanylate cyclase (GGDEF)-like protein
MIVIDMPHHGHNINVNTMLKGKALQYKSWLVIIFFVMLVSAFSAFTLHSIKRDRLEQIGTSLKAILQTVEKAHHIWIDQRKNSVLNLANRTEVINLSEQLIALHRQGKPVIGSESLANIRQVIGPYLTIQQDRGFFIITPDRTSIASMRDSNIGTVNLIETNRSILMNRSFEGETIFIPPIYSDVPLEDSAGTKAALTPTLFITTPIKKPDGEVIAVLAVRLNSSNDFSNITQLGRIGNASETYAFDEKAKLITHTRFDYQLTRAKLIRPFEHGILNIRIVDPGGNLLEGYNLTVAPEDLPLTLMAQSAIAGNSGINIEGYRDYRGVMVLGAWSWLEGSSYGLASEIDREEALGTYYKTRNSLFFLVALICLLGIAMRMIIERLKQKASQDLAYAHATLEQRVQERTFDLESTQTRLSLANIDLRRLATYDKLTDLHNRRHFDTCLDNEWHRCMRHQDKIALILFDVDFFKPFNDNYGHQAGDSVLTRIGKLMNELTLDKRPGDCVARYGGEEFVILLSNTTVEYVEKTAEKIRQGISDLRIKHQYSQVQDIDWITASIGMAVETPHKHTSKEQLLRMADLALYSAKAAGRDRVISDHNDQIKAHSATILPLKSK